LAVTPCMKVGVVYIVFEMTREPQFLYGTNIYGLEEGW
jgi:hypothetical protein